MESIIRGPAIHRLSVTHEQEFFLLQVFPRLSSKRVLTMTFEEGVSLNDEEGLAALGADPAEVTKLFCVHTARGQSGVGRSGVGECQSDRSHLPERHGGFSGLGGCQLCRAGGMQVCGPCCRGTAPSSTPAGQTLHKEIECAH